MMTATITNMNTPNRQPHTGPIPFFFGCSSTAYLTPNAVLPRSYTDPG